MGFVDFAFLCVLIAVGYWWWWSNQPRKVDHYKDIRYGYHKVFAFEQTFTTKTPGQFSVQYRLKGSITRVNDEEFKRARMLDVAAQKKLVEDYNNEVFLRFVEEGGFFFRCRWLKFELWGTPLTQTNIVLNRVVNKGGERITERVPNVYFLKALQQIEFVKNGCQVNLGWMDIEIWDNRIIEENFKMMTPEIVEKLERDPEYNLYEEAMVVGAMQRRLELTQKLLQEESDQVHETDMVWIKTARTGKSVKIEWRIKLQNPSGYDLMGFRKEDGFALDEWSESSNGSLVIHSPKDGSIVEDLNEGRTYFYTFFLKAWGVNKGKTDPLRFQIRIPRAVQFEEIERQLSKIEARIKKVVALEAAEIPLSPKQEKLNKALEELGLFVELDEAIESVEEKLRKKIEEKHYPPEEKTEKLDRLKGLVESIRDRHL